MHSSVLQNKKYIDFADENTVEVISLGSLEQGIEAGDRKAGTYEAEEAGKKVEYLVEFPGLTVAEMLALNKSKASSYNDTGRIPFTCVVDPYTLKEVQRWSGGQAAGTLMDAVSEFQKTLAKEHGKPVSRKSYRAIEAGRGEIASKVAASDFLGAFDQLEDLEKKHGSKHERLAEVTEKLKIELLGSLEKHMDGLADLAKEGDRNAAADLRKLARVVKGTELAERHQQLVDGIGG